MYTSFEQGRDYFADFSSGNPQTTLPDFSVGGLKGRFSNGKVKRIGRYDPFANERVVMNSEPAYQNWLLRRFDTAVLDLDARREPWSALHKGKHVEVRPHLFIQWKNQAPTLEVVATTNRGLSARALEALEVVAKAHGVEASVRTAWEVQADNIKLLPLLEWLIQRVGLYARHERLRLMEEHVANLLRNSGPWIRADVVGAMRCMTKQGDVALVDAALFKLRHAGKIRLDLSSGAYGDASIIEPIL